MPRPLCILDLNKEAKSGRGINLHYFLTTMKTLMFLRLKTRQKKEFESKVLKTIWF